MVLISLLLLDVMRVEGHFSARPHLKVPESDSYD